MKDDRIIKDDFEILNGSKILIVDDIQDNIKLLGQNLNKFNVKISVATNGLQAVNTANKVKPDLILMDINMPEMDGIDATKLIKSNPKTHHIPIIFITALAEQEDVIRGFEVGGVDYVTKPFNTKIMLQRVKTHLTLKFQKDKIELTNKKLIYADIEKNKFLSIIAHDLKSPFAGILGLMKIIVEEYESLSEEEKIEFITSVNDSLKNQYEFLDNLLSWSKIQFGKTKMDRISFNFPMLLDKILGVFKLNYEAKNIKIVKKIENPDIFGDVNMMYSVFHNFLANAIKFTKENGTITITSSEEDNHYKFSVIDNGIGMDPKTINSLFKIDEIRSRPGTNQEPGTGLGLILCKEIVEQHHGKLIVESKENFGTKLIVELPKTK